MSDFYSEMDRLFDSFFGSKDQEEVAMAAFTPPVDIDEREKEYQISVELPGLKKEDIKLSVKDNMLVISGEKKQEKKVDEKNYHRVERIFGSFQRSFRLPDHVDQNGIAAEFKDGVLVLNLPKLKEALPKQIEVSIK